MEYKINLLPIIIALFIVNAAGILLRYFNLDPYIILIGFRFHISLVIPFLIIFRKDQLKFIKNIFVNPDHKRTVLPLLWILLPILLIMGALFLLNKIELGDPDYFYEFGLSSIIDYPVYLIWNFPQIIAFFLFLVISSTCFKSNFLSPFIFTALLFVFEFIPFELKNYNYLNVISLLFVSLSAGILLKYFRNIYWFAIFLFSIFWLNFLAFGTQSREIINLLFAAQYSGWEGFFEVPKQLKNYLLPAQLFLTFLIVFISSLFRKRKSS